MKSPYQGSIQEYDVLEKKDVMVEMRDGVKLACDIYLPSNKNKIIKTLFNFKILKILLVLRFEL